MAAWPSVATSSGSKISPAIPPENPSSKLVATSPKPGINDRAEVRASTVPNKIVIGRVKNLIIP